MRHREAQLSPRSTEPVRFKASSSSTPRLPSRGYYNMLLVLALTILETAALRSPMSLITRKATAVLDAPVATRTTTQPPPLPLAPPLEDDDDDSDEGEDDEDSDSAAQMEVT